MRAFMAVVDWLPLVVVFAATVLLLAGCHEIGFRFAHRRNVTGTATPAQAVAIMSGVLALLSLMLAFTFSTAASRFEARRNAALDEVNAIGTTWLRSRLLPVADAEAIEPLLRRYVDIRLEGARTVSLAELERAIEESEALHEQMWRLPRRVEPRATPIDPRGPARRVTERAHRLARKASVVRVALSSCRPASGSPCTSLASSR